MKLDRKDWIWLAICSVVALYAAGRTSQVDQLRQQWDNLQVFTLEVQALDQKTRVPLQDVSIGAPTFSAGQFMKLTSTSVGGPGLIVFQYIGQPPFQGTLSVTNAGYESKDVRFGSTNCDLSVFLVRKVH
jgi:hypothetical protein